MTLTYHHPPTDTAQEIAQMNHRIVIVDDNALDRRILELLVAELQNTEVVSFASSAAALQAAPTLDASLFIVDYRMPAPDGMALLSSIRADHALRDTPVVMVTAAEEREVCYAALERGASDFLVRPIDPREFTRRIGNLLALHAARLAETDQLRREEHAARMHSHRLELIWRAGSSTDDDHEFLRRLIDDASYALVDHRRFSAAIARVQGDDFTIEVTNDPHAEETASASELPSEWRGTRVTGASIFAPFQVGAVRYSLGFYSTEPLTEPFTAFDTAFVDTIGNLCASRMQQRAQFERLRYQTEHDALTAILNRTSFRARGFAALRAAKTVALFVLNVDNFRLANNTLGQQTGDALLVEVAAALQAAAGPDETVARLGGDTFGILSRACASRADAIAIADRFLGVFDFPFGTGDREDLERVSLEASVGIALAPADGKGFELLLAHADAACFAAKDAGGARWSFFDPTLEQRDVFNRTARNELVNAIAKEQFVLHFQPHVDISTGRVVGAEALIRWQHPERGLLQPADFIPFAERYGLSGAIGSWVMRETARITRAWRREDPSFKAWFNLSAAELRDATLVDRLREVDDNLAGLGVEITESAAMENVAETLAVTKGLRDAGVFVALDDFGTGYSSLAHLKRLPIDVVKIDRAFITGLPDDQQDIAIVKAVLSIARSYGFETLAEGVERPEQAAFLLDAGCTLAQGFAYGRPVVAAQFGELLRKGEAIAT